MAEGQSVRLEDHLPQMAAALNETGEIDVIVTEQAAGRVNEVRTAFEHAYQAAYGQFPTFGGAVVDEQQRTVLTFTAPKAAL